MTSRNEGMPLVAVEAGGCGVPVVAPPVGGLADLIAAGAVQGAERTASALAAACARMLAGSQDQQAVVARGHALARLLTPERLASRYVQLYRQLSAPHPRRVDQE
jgi:glycosyltransferase involved in cell wall biosynthesis